MRYFEQENRLKTDDCALTTQELQNRSLENYYLYNNYNTNQCDLSTKDFTEFVMSNPNLRYRDGYGVTNQCYIDNDSELRNNAKVTNFRGKEQLCPRWNQAVPDLGHGGLIPNVESRLKYSEDTLHLKECDIVAEKNFNRFTPMINELVCSVQNPKHIILPFPRGGEFTRDYVQNDDYLKRCGFINDGKAWRRAQLGTPSFATSK